MTTTTDERNSIWEVKVGTGDIAALREQSPNKTADELIRQEVINAWKVIFGHAPDFLFSGFGATLTESQMAALEGRDPDQAADNDHLVGDPLVRNMPMYEAMPDAEGTVDELDEMLRDDMCDAVQFVRDDSGTWWAQVRVNNGFLSGMTWFTMTDSHQAFVDVVHGVGDAKPKAAYAANRAARAAAADA